MIRTKWRIQDVWVFLKDCFKAILQGQLFLRLNIGRFLIHMIYMFSVFTLTIWISLRIDMTMTKIADNKKILSELEIKHANLEFKLRELDRMTAVKSELEKQGSKLREPQTPVSVLK